MAEFCWECWNKINKTDKPKHEFVLSKELDICEGCGKIKPVVIRLKGFPFFFFS